jgi:hypothetical protein
MGLVLGLLGLVLGGLLGILALAGRTAAQISALPVLALAVYIGYRGTRGMSGNAKDYPRTIPDEVYVTSARVIAVAGLEWAPVSTLDLVVLGDVRIYADWIMRLVGVSWMYVLPVGAKSAGSRKAGAFEVAPGVLEVQSLSSSDATRLKAQILEAAADARRRGGG